MKKMILISFVTVLSFDLFAIEEADYLRLLYNASKTTPILRANIDKDKAKDYLSVSDVAQFNSLPPAEALPILIASLEKGVITNRIETFDNIIATNMVVAFANCKAYYLMGLSFGFASVGTVAFPWLTGTGQDLTIPATQYHYFWWYEGRKYLPNIWENWYACWQMENGRDNPRELVLNQLANEIAGFGYHIFPYLTNAIETDSTLTNVLLSLKGPQHDGWVFEDFSKWYRENKVRFTLPECETLKKTLERTTLEKMPISKSNKDNMLRWQKNEEQFYTTNSFNNYYWYYKVNAKEDISEEDIFQAKYGD